MDLSFDGARKLSIDQVHKLQKLLFAVTAMTFADDLSGSHIVGAKERDDAMAVIVMALTFGQPRRIGRIG